MVHEHDNVILGRALFESEYSPSILVLVANLSPTMAWNSVSTNQAKISTRTSIYYKFEKKA